MLKETLCWCDGREVWQCAEDIAEIQAALGAAQSANKESDGKIHGSVFDKVMSEMEKKEERFVDDDETLYVWNANLEKYEPHQTSEYDVDAMTFHREEEKIPSIEEAKKKEEASEKALKRKDTESEEHWSDPKKTTSVYVTGLPFDVTTEEVAVLFSKCGVLKEDEDGVRVKIYRDKTTGLPKGDGLVTYMKRPSVELAINILGGTPFRPEMKQTMTIQEAKFEKKAENKTPKKQKKKNKKNTREEKLLGWGGFDDHLSSHKITVILKHMFHPDEFLNGAISKDELKSDVKQECEKLGEVDRVIVYEDNEDGIVSVRFRNEEAADACVKRMHGRFFSKRQIEADKWDGFTKYHKREKAVTVEDEEVRLEQFAQDLEKG